MAAIFEVVKVTTGDAATAKTYYFKTKAGIYDGAVATATGVTKGTADDQDQPTTSIGQLLQKGILIRVKASSTVNGRRRTYSIVCARHKLATILDDLEGMSYNGRALDTARFPTRRTFY